MNIYKDICRILALVLIVGAVYKDSVAWAIGSGMLYMGGFDASFHIKTFIKSRFKNTDLPEAPKTLPDNVVQLRRGWAVD